MFKGLLSKFQHSSDKLPKQYRSLILQINELEPQIQQLSDTDIKGKTAELRNRIRDGDTLEDILPEAFALVREASVRTLGLRHFDVQLLGGIILHNGKVAEMGTGEGKTLVATLPVYLNAIDGKGVHVVTVNDYLARRDLSWMGPIYDLLGLSVGCLQHEIAYLYSSESDNGKHDSRNLKTVSRKEAYDADITYGTNHEFGFDYLRDNMGLKHADIVQRDLHYAIVDEVDYILIDEARTPLIISGPTQVSTKLYPTMAHLATTMADDSDYDVDFKHRSVMLTDEGVSKVERTLGIENLYDHNNVALTHFVDNALKASVVYKKDKDYVVKDGEVVIVDEFTGRLMQGRRYGDGLHQAIEAKEGVKIQQETATYATITLQNYFRMYEKLSGMTGTATTEAEEFQKIYKLDVSTVPSNRSMIRKDMPDLVYKTDKGKWEAIVTDIVSCFELGQPVLVGTTSIDKSEKLSKMLSKRKIPHNVLNAKQHDKEASIVAQAGVISAVTVATNMAGRGTDIILGGNPDGRDEEEWKSDHDQVLSLGGLYVLGTEKHESRRVDNQLRGRSGRQGDEGMSRFYVSLEDELMVRFGGERIKSIMGWAGIPDDQPMEHRTVSKAIENSQAKVEGYHFEIRKSLVDYDDVVNKHRDVIYEERHKLLGGADLRSNTMTMLDTEIKEIFDSRIVGADPKDWDLDSLLKDLNSVFPFSQDNKNDNLASMGRDELEEEVMTNSRDFYSKREKDIGLEKMREIERLVMLRGIDTYWVEHLTAMSTLRDGIALQAVGNRDPLVAYKMQGTERFKALLERIRSFVARTINYADVSSVNTATGSGNKKLESVARMSGTNSDIRSGNSRQNKVGRNETCPCGSGKKFKKCHGSTS